LRDFQVQGGRGQHSSVLKSSPEIWEGSIGTRPGKEKVRPTRKGPKVNPAISRLKTKQQRPRRTAKMVVLSRTARRVSKELREMKEVSSKRERGRERFKGLRMSGKTEERFNKRKDHLHSGRLGGKTLKIGRLDGSTSGKKKKRIYLVIFQRKVDRGRDEDENRRGKDSNKRQALTRVETVLIKSPQKREKSAEYKVSRRGINDQ